MKKELFPIITLLAITLLLGCARPRHQATVQYILDSTFAQSFTSSHFQPAFDFNHRSPTDKDKEYYAKYGHLAAQQPGLENYHEYYLLACALWQLEKNEEAEKMFLTILAATEKFYASDYYHSSDIPGDTTSNTYGYGSYTSNYKNYAAIYLVKIYLSQKEFAKALQYLEDAVKKYKVTYTCGTGFRQQQDEYEFLYASCYLGLNRHKDVIDLLLPSCLERSDEMIVTALKNTYSKKQIADYLQKAEASVTFIADSIPSFIYTNAYSDTTKKEDTITYYAGTATITLFNKSVKIPTPFIEKGEVLARDSYITFFRESDFYRRLKEDE